MTEAHIQDPERLLAPIDAEAPAGEDLAGDEILDEIEEARREDLPPAGRSSTEDVWQRRKVKRADWPRTVALCEEVLIRRSKDLNVAAWLTEALGRTRGFPGVRLGFLLLDGLLVRFGDDAYPRPDPDEPMLRQGPFQMLEDPRHLPYLMRSLPLLDDGRPPGPLSLDHYRRRVEDAGEDSESTAAPTADAGFAVISVARWEEAAESTRAALVLQRRHEVRECRDAFETLRTRTIQCFGASSAPALDNIRSVLKDAFDLLEGIVRRRGLDEPAPPETPPAAVSEPEPESELPDAGSDSSAPDVAEPVRPARPAAAVPSSPTGPRSVEEARRWITAAAALLLRETPESSAAHLVVRALAAADLHDGGRPLDPSRLIAPESQERRALRDAAREERWTDLLELTAAILGRPAGRGWLEPRRWAISALDGLGRSNAADACRSELAALLGAFPDLMTTRFDDDTATVGPDSLRWIEEEILPPAPAPTPPSPPPPPPVLELPPSPAEDDGPSDPIREAERLASRGAFEAAVGLLSRSVREANGEAERFRRKLALAELSGNRDDPRRRELARALFEELEGKIDEFSLERWDPLLCARVLVGLHRSLGGAGTDDASIRERVRRIEQRLCRLDPDMALTLLEST